MIAQSGTPAERVASLLAVNGVKGAGVRAAGTEGEIAVIAAPPSAAPCIAELAAEIRALGFRYVTLELGGRGDDDA